MSLHIGHFNSGNSFVLPDELLTHTVAILAKKGAGKTYAAGVIEEEFAEQRLPFVVLDPVGVHYGIRSTADGKERAYPVVVFGGEHGDIPIERDMGEAIAEEVVEENISCIIDLSELSKGAWRQFVMDFCRELYRRNRNTNPRHVFIEEATEFVPQTRRPEMQPAYEAVERLVRMGRNRGLGVTLISQRSAQVAKDVLSQLDVLIALRTVGAHDRKALLDMFEGVLEHDDLPKLEEFKRTIPRLEDGVAWIWSPEFLKCFEQVRIRERRTFHGGATVQVSEIQLVQAKPDVSALRKRLAPPPESPEQPQEPGQGSCDHLPQIRGLENDVNENIRTILNQEQEIERLTKLTKHNERLSEELTQYREDAGALQQIRGALRIGEQTRVLGADGQENFVDEEAIIHKVLARLPSNGSTPVQVTPPEALRKKYLVMVAERLYRRVEQLTPLARRMMELLLGQDKFWPVTVVSTTLTGQDGGSGFTSTQTAAKELSDVGLVIKGGSGGKQYKANVQKLVETELAPQGAKPDEVADVVQHVLAEVAA